MSDCIKNNLAAITLAVLSAIVMLYIIRIGISESIESLQSNNETDDTVPTTMSPNIPRRVKKVLTYRPAYPVCLYSDYLTTELNNLIVEIQTKRTKCLPCEKKQRVVWRTGKEMGSTFTTRATDAVDDDSRGIGVVWCVVGLLILSVIASIIDVLNAKKPKIKKTSSIDIAGNPAAAPRRSSLASLTASRHTRRQVFGSRRPASISEGSTLSKNSSPTQPAGRRNSSWRRSSSPYDSGDPPLGRRDSVMAGLIDSEDDSSTDSLHKRIRIIRRF